MTIYDYEYFEGKRSNYWKIGGYNGLRVRIMHFFIFRKAFSFIKKYKRNGTALDCGCAYGFFVNFLYKRKIKAYGCDISSFAIKMANRLFPWLRFYHLDIEREVLAKKFDIITAFEVLEHCKNINNALENMKKMLKKDGIMLITVPDKTLSSNDCDKTHRWWFNLKEWKELLESCGFSVVKWEHFPKIFYKIKHGWYTTFFLCRHHQ